MFGVSEPFGIYSDIGTHCAVPDSVRAAEGVLLHKQAAESGKPANVVEKMVLGRLNKCAFVS